MTNTSDRQPAPGTIIQVGRDPDIYEAAKQYHDSTKGMDKLEYTFPYLTNLGFAIELYIKCMDVETWLPPDADASHLFSSVSIPSGGGVAIDRVKGDVVVRAKVRRKQGNSHSLLCMFNNHREELKQAAIEAYKETYQSDLDADLERLGVPFVYWRYAYEHESSHAGFRLPEQIAEFFHDFAGALEMKVFFVKAVPTL